MKLNYSKKILILSLIILVGIFILDVIFTNLLLNKISDINNKVKQLNLSSQEREKELNLKGSIDNSKIGREKLLNYFVGAGNAETVAFTKYLENLAAEMGVAQKKTLDYEVASELGSADNISVIHFRFNVSGRWSNVYNFLLAIENLPKVAKLNSVSFSVGSEAVSAGEVKTGAKIWSADLDFSVVKLK